MFQDYEGLGYLGAAIPISLQIDSPYQVVGKKGTFKIIGAPPGSKVFWSSYKDGVSTGELNAAYEGQVIEPNGTAALETTWAPEHVGNWIKEILVQDAAGQNYTAMVQFVVLPAESTAPTAAPAPQQSFWDKGFDIGGTHIPVWVPIAVGAFVLMKRK